VEKDPPYVPWHGSDDEPAAPGAADRDSILDVPENQPAVRPLITRSLPEKSDKPAALGVRDPQDKSDEPAASGVADRDSILGVPENQPAARPPIIRDPPERSDKPTAPRVFESSEQPTDSQAREH
jgi:hypothetical protein